MTAILLRIIWPLGSGRKATAAPLPVLGPEGPAVRVGLPPEEVILANGVPVTCPIGR